MIPSMAVDVQRDGVDLAATLGEAPPAREAVAAEELVTPCPWRYVEEDSGPVALVPPSASRATGEDVEAAPVVVGDLLYELPPAMVGKGNARHHGPSLQKENAKSVRVICTWRCVKTGGMI